MMPPSIRIGAGQAFWGDDITVPRWQVEQGHLDYLIMDFLAELTMSILQKQKLRDPKLGFAADIVPIMQDTLPAAAANGTKIIANAGGVNPVACGRAVRTVAEHLGLGDWARIAVVVGDDLLPSLPAIAEQHALANHDTGAAFETIASRVVSANAYLGSTEIAAALDAGANIVLTGRCTDSALALGPLIHEFGWAADDWDRLAAGIVSAHLIECGAQATGGNHQAGWQNMVGLDRVGYPIVEVTPDGHIEFTKTPGSGGAVDRETALEQLLYEIGDPSAYLTPDVTVDWTSITMTDAGHDRVLVRVGSGRPPPETLKVSITYHDGYMTSLMFPYAAPDAVAKAHAAQDILAKKIARLGLQLDGYRADIFGCGAIHGPRTPVSAGEPVEVLLRVAARSPHRDAIERLAIEVAPMHFGPAGLAGYIGGGRGRVSQVLSHWSALVDRSVVRPDVIMI